ncbi:MAG: hypothetical protein HQL56_14975, partial [Magnetococcales bacterium]|nr:hypothetical protein [Magnetococcales bacterium]
MNSSNSTEINVGTVGQGGQVGNTIYNCYPPTPSLRLDLHPVKWQSSNTSRFRYSSQGTQVFSRQEEQARLRQFLNSCNTPFCWWMIGGPGGMGKSRLAFELALEASQNGWEAGFLPPGTGSRERHTLMQTLPDEWPSRPTLLILDYIAGEEEETGVSVACLARRGKSTEPLRLLLLERDTNPEAPWWPRFWGSGEQLSILEESRYDLPLTLAPLPLEAMALIVKEWPGAKPPAAQWHSLLQRLHFGGRPLYAAFLADALEAILVGGREQWDDRSLVTRVLKREQSHWKQSGVTDKDIHLLVLTTLCGGLDTSRKDLPKYVRKLLKSAAQVQEPDFSARCLTMTGHTLDEAQPHLFPLEPDLLGELLFLEELRPKSPTAEDPHAKVRRNSLATAWALNPLRVFATLSRAAQDFPDHPGLFVLAKKVPDGLLGRLFWAQMVVNVIAYAGGVKTFQASDLLNLLTALARDHDGEAPLRELQAKGAFNLINAYGNAGQIDEARGLYEAIAALARDHDGEAPLRELQA